MTEIRRENEHGLLEGIDSETGEVLWRQVPNKKQLRKIEKGLPLDVKSYQDTTIGRKATIPYTRTLALEIVRLITEGHTVRSISRMEGMPEAHIIYYWTKQHPDFGLEIEQAREFRAENFMDYIIEEAKQSVARGDVPAKKLELDTLKWAYEKATLRRVEKENKTARPMTIIVDTGIRRAK